jgi:hypothetical protein
VRAHSKQLQHFTVHFTGLMFAGCLRQ